MLDVLEENALSHAYYSQGFGFLDGRLYVNEHSGSDGHFAEHIFGLNGELLCLFTNDTAVVDKATGLAELVPKHFIDPVVGRVVPISNTRRFVSFETYYRGQGFGRTRWSLYDRKELARKLFETGQELEPWPTAFEWNLKHENSMFASDDAGIWSVEPDGNVAFTPRQIGSWDSGRVIESTVPIDPRRVEHYPALAGNRELLLENWELDNFEWTDRKTYTYTYCWIDQNQLLQQCTYDLLSGFAELCAGLGLDNRYEVWFVHPQHLLSGLALFSVFIKPTGNPQDLKELILIVNILSGDNILFELRVPASQSEEARNVLG